MSLIYVLCLAIVLAYILDKLITWLGYWIDRTFPDWADRNQSDNNITVYPTETIYVEKKTKPTWTEKQKIKEEKKRLERKYWDDVNDKALEWEDDYDD